MPDYEVRLQAQCVVVVLNADNEEQAHEWAADVAEWNRSTVYESTARAIFHQDDLERSIRHADAVSRD